MKKSILLNCRNGLNCYLFLQGLQGGPRTPSRPRSYAVKKKPGKATPPRKRSYPALESRENVYMKPYIKYSAAMRSEASKVHPDNLALRTNTIERNKVRKTGMCHIIIEMLLTIAIVVPCCH